MSLHRTLVKKALWTFTGIAGSISLLAAIAFASSWSIIVIETSITGEGIGTDDSLDFDPADTPHISYYDKDHDDLKYAHYVSSGGNCGPGNSWQCDTVEGGKGKAGKDTSIDASGNVAISYYDETNRDLKFAMLAGGTWTTEIADNGGGAAPSSSVKVGMHTSLEMDASGNAHISYFNESNKDLKYAVFVGAGNGNCGGSAKRWQCYAIDQSGDVGRYSSMALDGDGKAHISYYDQSNGDLKYAHEVGSGGNCGGGKFQCEVVDALGTTGRHTSIDIGNDGYPQIAYLDVSGHYVRYACKSADGWKLQTIENAPVMGDDESHEISLQIGSDGRPRIAFHDQGEGDLDFAMNVLVCGLGGLWVSQKVDVEQQVGTDPSLALDSADRPCISYYDNTNKRLKYTCWDSTPPALCLTCPGSGQSYWASYADYSNRVLSVDYKISNVGTVDGYQLTIVASVPTGGVSTATAFPKAVTGNLPAGSDASFTMKYNIPISMGTGSIFTDRVYATVEDAGGIVYYFPSQPP